MSDTFRIDYEQELISLNEKILLTVREARDLQEMSRDDLAEATGLAMSTISSIEDGGEFATNIGTAFLIAEALELDIEDIAWPRGLSIKGRPPLTGTAITAAVQRTLTLTLSETVIVGPAVCSRCNLALPVTLVCGNC